jgi:hypothetical protein
MDNNKSSIMKTTLSVEGNSRKSSFSKGMNNSTNKNFIIETEAKKEENFLKFAPLKKNNAAEILKTLNFSLNPVKKRIFS